jgi:hypothetical protein
MWLRWLAGWLAEGKQDGWDNMVGYDSTKKKKMSGIEEQSGWGKQHQHITGMTSLSHSCRESTCQAGMS